MNPGITTKTESSSKPPEVKSERVLKPSDPGYLKLLGYECAREICPEFIWTNEVREIMNILVAYFFDLNIPHSKMIDRRKGIALMGEYGVGKTISFRIIHRMLEKRYAADPYINLKTFKETSIEDIITAMKADDFTDGVLFKRVETIDGARVEKPLNILINEFGVEYSGKHFGTPISEMIDVFLMKRYEIFQFYGRATHATMNYSLVELEKKFSPRLLDRFREMFNFIELKGKSFRK